MDAINAANDDLPDIAEEGLEAMRSYRVLSQQMLLNPPAPQSWGECVGSGGHPQTPAKGALPLVESPFSYFMVLAASQHGGFLRKYTFKPFAPIYCHAESALADEASLPTGVNIRTPKENKMPKSLRERETLRPLIRTQGDINSYFRPSWCQDTNGGMRDYPENSLFTPLPPNLGGSV